MEYEITVSKSMYVGLPLYILLGVCFLLFVWKMPKDFGIYLGWLPSLLFLMLLIFTKGFILNLTLLIVSLVIYIVGTVLRLEKNKKLSKKQAQKLSEIDKMSIDDL